jgi:hypothetical protein
MRQGYAQHLVTRGRQALPALRVFARESRTATNAEQAVVRQPREALRATPAPITVQHLPVQAESSKRAGTETQKVIHQDTAPKQLVKDTLVERAAPAAPATNTPPPPAIQTVPFPEPVVLTEPEAPSKQFAPPAIREHSTPTSQFEAVQPNIVAEPPTNTSTGNKATPPKRADRFIVRLPPEQSTLRPDIRRTLERDVIATARRVVQQRRGEIPKDCRDAPVEVRVEKVEVKIQAPPAAPATTARSSDTAPGLAGLFLTRNVSGW